MIDLNKVNIIDKLLPSFYEDSLYNHYTLNSDWRLDNITSNSSYLNKSSLNKYFTPDNETLNNIQEGIQLVSTTLVSNDLNSKNFESIFLLHYLQHYLNYSYKIIPLKIKTNLQTPLPNPQKGFYNYPHVDLDVDYHLPHHYTLIYYVLDSDGDTIIYNEKYQGKPLEKLTINKKITPKRGLSVFFPYNTFHCGSHPVNSSARIVTNINFQLIPL